MGSRMAAKMPEIPPPTTMTLMDGISSSGCSSSWKDEEHPLFTAGIEFELGIPSA